MSKQQPEVYKEKLIEALKKTLGIVTPACEIVGISRDRFYTYYNTDEVFRKAVDDINEIQIDFVENSLMKKIQEGDKGSIIFYMKYKGKKRGYTNSIEVSGGTEPIQIKYILPENDKGDTNS
jgi:hypothetical protein